MMTILGRACQAFFAIVFLLLFLSAAAYMFETIDSLPLCLLSIAVFALIFPAVAAFYRFLRQKTINLSRKELRKIFFILSGGVFFLQVICLSLLRFSPILDLSYVNNAAMHFSENFDSSVLYADPSLPLRHKHYFSVYPNNHGLLVFLTLVYRLERALFGDVVGVLPLFINLFGLFISYLLTYFCAEIIFKDKTTPLFTAILAGGLSVFYTYPPYFYTDSLSMPFVMGAVYLFLRANRSDKLKSAVPCLLGCAFLTAVGTKIKGSVTIIFIAFIAVWIFSLKKGKIVKTSLKAAILGVSFALALLLANIFTDSFNITTAEELDRYRFPPQHWVMMGLYGRGAYNLDDFYYTYSFDSYEKKVDADVKVIKERLADYGAVGLCRHLLQKASHTWGDGTYMIGYYLKNSDADSFLARSFYKGYLPVVLCALYQMLTLLGIFLTNLFGALRRRLKPELLITIIVWGVLLFFLIWEAKSRYLMNFSPLFAILAAASFKELNLRLRLFILHRKNNERRK